MVIPRRKSMLSQEERIKRLKESRQKYSQIGKTRRNDEQPSASSASQVPPAVRLPVVPKPPIAPPRLTSAAGPLAPRPSQAPRASLAPKPVNSSRLQDDADFEVDPNSLAMINSGKITIPMNRPSISAPRTTLGSRQSLAGRPFSRFRNSIAQEPRPSLLPLGINVFEASVNQRNEVSDFLTNMITVPGSTGSSTTVSASAMNATRSRKIRFMETAIQEARDSAESSDVAAASTSIRHSPTTDTLFMPASILSTRNNSRKKVNLGDAPVPPTPRRLIFEDEESVVEPEQENIGKLIEEFEKIAELLSNPQRKLTSGEKKKLQEAVEKLEISLKIREQKEEKESTFKSPPKRCLPVPPVPLTPLGSILENVNLEDSAEEDELELSARKNKKLRRSSKMKVGGDARRPWFVVPPVVSSRR